MDPPLGSKYKFLTKKYGKMYHKIITLSIKTKSAVPGYKKML